MNTYIIIGSSAAGLTALSTLSRISNAHIICITKDSTCYNTCLLSAVLSNKKNATDIYLSVPQKSNGSITMLYNTSATSINRSEKAVYTSTGERIGYDTLLIATGSKPRQLPVQLSSENGIFYYHTLQDVLSIKSYISTYKVTTALVVGGGINGLECVASLTHAGIAVTLIECNSQILKNTVDSRTAQCIEKLFIKQRTIIKTEVTITSIEKLAIFGYQVYLSDGSIEQAQLLVFALGSEPSIDIAIQAHLVTNKAIVVNNTLRTSDPYIFAAGDCIETLDIKTNRPIQSTLWPDAILQAVTVSQVMVGFEKVYNGLIKAVHTEFFGIKLIIYGNTNTLGQEIVYTEHPNGHTVCFFTHNTITGCILYGHQENFLQLKSTIANKIDMSKMNLSV